MNRQNLIDGLKRGDRSAWNDFLKHHGRIIYAVPARMGLGSEDCEDVYQSTCIAVHRAIGTLRDPEKLVSWVYGIAYRISIDLLRKKKRARLVSNEEIHPDALVDPGAAPDEEVESLERVAHLLDALDLIDGRCRDLLKLLYLETPPLAYEAVAERLQMPLGSIGPTRQRCLAKLRPHLSHVSEEEASTSTD